MASDETQPATESELLNRNEAQRALRDKNEHHGSEKPRRMCFAPAWCVALPSWLLASMVLVLSGTSCPLALVEGSSLADSGRLDEGSSLPIGDSLDIAAPETVESLGSLLFDESQMNCLDEPIFDGSDGTPTRSTGDISSTPGSTPGDISSTPLFCKPLFECSSAMKIWLDDPFDIKPLSPQKRRRLWRFRSAGSLEGGCICVRGLRTCSLHCT